MGNTTNSEPSAAHAVPLASIGQSLENLTDAELLAGTRRLVGRSNQLLAELLAHLGEVETRGIHRVRACASLYTYCIYELRFSEDEAFRRVAAARFARRFPALLEALSAGELHLTGLLMLGPHLNDSNVVEVLARAKHRTKRELARLVRVLDPLPAVPALIDPLGPAPARLVPVTPTWEAFVQSMCPVRELTPGDRPRDWVEGANDASSGTTDTCDPMRARLADVAPTRHGNSRVHGGVFGAGGQVSTASGPEVAAPERVSTVAPDALAPERYKVQFTATDEYVRLVEEAKALLSHAVPHATLEELHLRAMRALVSELTKKKYAAQQGTVPRERRGNPANPHEAHTVAREPRGNLASPPEARSVPRERRGNPANPHEPRRTLPPELRHDAANPHEARTVPREPRGNPANPHEPRRTVPPELRHDAANLPEAHTVARERRGNPANPHEPRRTLPPESGYDVANPPAAGAVPHHPRQRGRHIPAAVRRALFERDGNRCTYVAATGERCAETHHLEFHHLTPFALGGEHDPTNVTLRCSAHNALAAEEDFGRELVEERRWASCHDPFRHQTLSVSSGELPG